MTRRNLFRLLAVACALPLALVLAKRKENKQTIEADRSTSAAIPAHADSFTLGRLAFQSCDLGLRLTGGTTRAYCAPFQVPEDWDEPAGRKLDLHLALIKSDADAADTDVVVFLDGGPGQAATEDYPVMAAALSPLRKHHHILLLDQRGTGQSHPLVCKGHKEKPDETANEKDFDPDEVRRQTKDCLDEVVKTSDPRQFTTTVATRDLEALRQAIGAPLFDLVGVSYGTRMAQQYLKRHPEGVRSVVLDSVVPNELILAEDHAINLENALKAELGHCRETPDCAKAFGDPYASLFALRDALRAKPVNYSYRDPATNAPVEKHIDSYTLAGLVRMFSYAPETAALLPLSIAEASKGNYTPLAGQSQLLTGDLAGLQHNGMQFSVLCSEDADLLTPRPEDKTTLLGTTLIDATIAACSVWPHGSRPPDFHEPLSSDKPILVLEGELDPVTPPRYGEQVIRGASKGKLIVGKGQGHGLLMRGCVPKIVKQFVETLDTKTLDTKCAELMGPLPALIDFNGASP